MSAGKGATTTIGAIVLALVGFAAGAAGSAWQTRERRADPWRKLKVEHEGLEGATTRTRVVFENPKLALQAAEVIRNPEGDPELAHVTLRDGGELTARYEDDTRPTSIEGADGGRADLSYEGAKVRVTFVAPGGEEIGGDEVAVPVDLRSALRLAAAAPPARWRSEAWGALDGVWIGQAWAQPAPAEEDPSVTVQRDVELVLDIRTPKGKGDEAGRAEIEASCAPFTCLPAAPNVEMPGEATVRILVTGTTKRSALDEPDGKKALDPFRKRAVEERAVAQKVLPDVAGLLAAVGVTALACKSQKLDWPICVKDLGKTSTAASGAIIGVGTHDVPTEGRVVDERAEALYYEEQARAALDAATRIEVCLSRDGFARSCTTIEGEPFGEEAMEAEERTVELRRGIGGTLVGSFVVTQSDGADCRFSPSPRTSGAFRLTFDNETRTATASMKANERGSRPDLSCNLGTANMTWSQNYTVTATQTFTKEQLEAGGQLPLQMKGTMSGTGGFSFSNCRTSGGASANCPAGKNEGYSYPVELSGTLDMDKQTGKGTILVRNAPLATGGSWQVPADPAVPGAAPP